MGLGFLTSVNWTFGAIDVEEKGSANFRRVRVCGCQSYDNAIECGNE